MPSISGPASGQAGSGLLKLAVCNAQRSGKSHDAGYIFGACAFASLLCAAVNQIVQRNPSAAVEGAYSLRSVEFVSGQGEHINIHFFYVDFYVSDRLYGIGVEQNACLAADGSDFFDRVDGSDFVVGKHDGNQSGLGADGAAVSSGADLTLAVHRIKVTS